MKMSPEDLASLKDAIKRQKGGGGDDINFVEVSLALSVYAILVPATSYVSGIPVDNPLGMYASFAALHHPDDLGKTTALYYQIKAIWSIANQKQIGIRLRMDVACLVAVGMH